MNILDIICILPIAYALFVGLRKGLIIELASLAAFIVAILACLVLTHAVLELIKPYTGDSKWLPFVSYIITFAAAYLLVYWMGKLIEKVVQIMQLGMLNRLFGMLFSLLKMCFFISLIMWVADMVHLVPDDTKAHSYAWKTLHSFAPATLKFISSFIPGIKDQVDKIEHFFQSLR